MGASATVLGLLVSSAFVVLPVIGRPPVVRPAPILLFALIVIAAVSGPWRWTEAEWSAVANWNPSRRVIHAGALVVGLVLFWFVLTRFQSGEINAIDFTVYYDRPTFQTLQGRPAFVESADDPIRAFRSYFAVHAHWVMLPLAAFYLVWATPLWLLALSVAAVVLGAICTLRIVQHIGGGMLLDLPEDMRRRIPILEARPVGKPAPVRIAALREVDPVGRHLVGHLAIPRGFHRELR